LPLLQHCQGSQQLGENTARPGREILRPLIAIARGMHWFNYVGDTSPSEPETIVREQLSSGISSSEKSWKTAQNQ
jgi:hypothetical protein